jgi:flagellum-specific ATP synthase
MPELDTDLAALLPSRIEGRVVRLVGLTAAVAGFPVPIGAQIEIERHGTTPLMGEVVGFKEDQTLVYPLGSLQGVRPGSRARLVHTQPWLRVGSELCGRVINACGKAIDGQPQPVLRQRIALDQRPPAPLERPRIDSPLSTGIRALDALLTCGKGQRMGIFSGSGVGKSMLLGMMARHSSADVNVIALIGERGREVNEFLARDLGKAGLSRSVVVVATGDEPALLRLRAAYAATAIAEYFRDQGQDVLLIMDSLTRFALAQRELGLAAGEPPTTRGYPPSVFAVLPRLVERAGRSQQGSITAFYSVLVEADDPNEPIADTVRGLLDGHTWLSRKLAARGHYPAIDVLESISRLMLELVDPQHREAARVIRTLLAVHRDHEDLISVGAYRKGTNRALDAALELLGPIQQFLQQRPEEASNFQAARDALCQLRAQALAAGMPAEGQPAGTTARPPATSAAPGGVKGPSQ